ncbi:hypothetical protein Vretimale_18317 [Volvox reticuliferus]|uniref:Uncharacterized protein n=1 Tax=Volvox reticuliferus TaxID=1737510 RepID=A0A8J4GWR1_9CHLO|nr:hypothetical protein Vretimale_18317 [Volvox reticuliferus]
MRDMHTLLNAFLNTWPKINPTTKPSAKLPAKPAGNLDASTSSAGATPEEHIKAIGRTLNLKITKDATFPASAHNLSAAELKTLYEYYRGGPRRFCWTCENKKLLPQFHDPEVCPLKTK